MKKDKKPVIAYLQTHWDAEWYKTSDSFDVRLVEVFDKVLNGFKTGQIPFFYFDGQVYALLNYLKFRPEKENLIKKLIKEKKLFIGPFFASIDSFLSSGCSLIKNLEIGLKYSKRFNENDFIGYLPDTFGHSKSIFKILEHFKIKNAIIWRGTPDISSDFIMNNIKTTRLVYGYYQDILHTDLSLDKKAEILEKILDKINKKSGDILLLPLGGDHLAPFKNPKDTICEINKRLKKYEIKLSSPFEYLKKANYSKEKFEGEFLDNSETYILQGVYSTRTDEKAENAKLQYALFNKVEPLNYFLKGKYKSELDFATLTLLKNQAHDSVYGCSIDEVHQKVKCRQLTVKETINTVKKHLIRDFKDKYLKEENNNFIGIFNISNYKQNGTVKIITDKKIKEGQKIKEFVSVSDDILYNPYRPPVTEDFHKFYEYLIEINEIEPFSFKNFKIKNPVQKQTIGNDFIENEFIKLFILDNKICVLDKINKKLYEDFINLQTTPDGGDSYNFAPLAFSSNLKLKTSKIKTRGKIKSTLSAIFEENIKLNFSLSNNSKMLEIEADFINKKKNRFLQIVFNTDKPVKKTVADDGTGEIERYHNPNYSILDNMPPKNKEEVKTNLFPMEKYVKTNGIGIITKGLNCYEIYKNSIKVGLLRSIGIISNPNNPARKIPAGPPIDCPDMQGIGGHKFNLAVTFNDNINELAENFYDPFVSILGEFKIKNKTYLNAENKKAFLGIVQGKPLYL